MPIIKIYGLTNLFVNIKVKKISNKMVLKANKENIENIIKLNNKIKSIVCKVLNLKINEVSVIVIPTFNIVKKGIIIEVTGLFEKTERTEEVRNDLAKQIVDHTKETFDMNMIECFIYPFNPQQGFASNYKKEKK